MAEGARGFTLLEVMVAFVVASLVLGAAYRTISGASEAALRADAALAALTAAEAALARVGAEIPLVPGETRIAEAGLVALVEIRPAREGSAGLGLGAMAVTVEMRGEGAEGAPALRLETLRLAGAE